MKRTIVLWSIALFFGCSILFRAVGQATADLSTAAAFAIQVGVLVVVVVVVIAVAKRRL